MWSDPGVPYSIRDITPHERTALLALGRTMRRARLAHGLTQMRLEERTGVDQTTISRLERGTAPGMRLMWLIRVIVALRLDPERLAPPAEFVIDGVLEALRLAAERAAEGGPPVLGLTPSWLRPDAHTE